MWEICCNRLAPMRLGLTFQQVQKYEKGTNRRLQYGLGYGADDYMTKPFHKDELVARDGVHHRFRIEKSAKRFLPGRTRGAAWCRDSSGSLPASSGACAPGCRRTGRPDLGPSCRKKAHQSLGRQGLHRDGVGARLCAARAERGRGKDFRLTIPSSECGLTSPAAAGCHVISNAWPAFGSSFDFHPTAADCARYGAAGGRASPSSGVTANA